MLLMRRRLIDAGQIAIQTFENDWLPLLLLLAISVTGLGITLDYRYMGGQAHQFMAITHAVTVILFLVWMPIGKFYHIIQRPAQLGIAIYRRAGREGEQAICPHTGEAFTSKMHIDDLKAVTAELGYDYTLADGSSHLDLSPQGKRAALAKAHLAARQAIRRVFSADVLWPRFPFPSSNSSRNSVRIRITRRARAFPDATNRTPWCRRIAASAGCSAESSSS